METSSPRDTYLDCVKGALILLVVLGHSIEVFITSSPTYKAAYSAIYIFHMPLLVFTVGMFSKVLLAQRDYSAILSRLVLPLIFFHVAYLIPASLTKGAIATPPLQPHWLLWFILSAILWKLTLPLFARLPFAIPISLALAILAGFNEDIGYAFSLSRSIYFFPFFLIGHFHGRQIVNLVVNRPLVFRTGFFAIIAGIAIWSINGLDHVVLYGSKGYASAAAFENAPALGRALVLALSFVCAIGFLGLVPKRSAVLAFLGQRILAIFLLHGFLIMAFAQFVKRSELMPSPWFIPVLAFVAMMTACFLALLDRWLTCCFDRLTARSTATQQRP